jgi:hypothetical protein
MRGRNRLHFLHLLIWHRFPLTEVSVKYGKQPVKHRPFSGSSLIEAGRSTE